MPGEVKVMVPKKLTDDEKEILVHLSLEEHYKYYENKMDDFLMECKETLGIEPKEVYNIIEQLERNR